jgi:hypothetical protein
MVLAITMRAFAMTPPMIMPSKIGLGTHSANFDEKVHKPQS